MANKGFDYPAGALTDEAFNVTPVWDQWINRVHQIALSVQQSGTTAERPTAGLWVGRQFFDTTLGKPAWVKSVRPSVWVDGSGAVV